MMRRTTFLGLAAALSALTVAQPVAAHGRVRGGRGPVVVVGGRFGGFGGYYPYWGWGSPYYYCGFSPFYGPYAWRPEGGVDMNVAMMAGYGAVDLDVKPGDAEVWVDGKFLAEAKNLDGYPSYLWLKEGAHHLVVYKGGFRKFEEDVEVDRGVRKELKIRLEKGDAEPPGRRPAGAV